MLTPYVYAVARSVRAHLPPNPVIGNREVEVLRRQFALTEEQMLWIISN